MIDTLAFLGAFAAFVYILYWSVKNDEVSSTAEQTGFLRLKEGHEPKRKPQTASPSSYLNTGSDAASKEERG